MPSVLPPIDRRVDYILIMKSERIKFDKKPKHSLTPQPRLHQLSGKARLFSVHLDLPTDEEYVIDRVCPSMYVRTLKDRIELETGIPRHLLRLRYLDGYDLDNDRRLAYYNVVPAATILVLLWPEWVELVRAAWKGDYYGVLACRIRNAPSLDPTGPREFNEKAIVALFISSHRGHVYMVSHLVQAGVYPCTKLPSGRSPLHAAVNQRHITCVSILIGRSRGLDDDKASNDNAVRKSTFYSISSMLAQKDGWKQIVQQYQARMRRHLEKSKLPAVPRREFQKYDSTFPTYLTGPLGRLYLCNILQTEARHVVKRIPRPWY